MEEETMPVAPVEAPAEEVAPEVPAEAPVEPGTEETAPVETEAQS